MAASHVHAPDDDTYLRAINEAHTALEHAKHMRNRVDANAAHHRLRVAVEAARDAGVSWMQIGDLLDITRGNAYRRYRTRPVPRSKSNPSNASGDLP